ncbi:TPA: hypothetical protein ACKQBO_004979 [Pseudomonas aeruginosa]
MKVVRRYPLALLLGMAGALADELPDGSLLQRYGVQADQLPTLAADPPSRKEEKETPSRFRVEPEQPLVTFGVKDHKGMEPTGNPSIDAMHERDRRICRNIRRQALEKGTALRRLHRVSMRPAPAYERRSGCVSAARAGARRRPAGR